MADRRGDIVVLVHIAKLIAAVRALFASPLERSLSGEVRRDRFDLSWSALFHVLILATVTVAVSLGNLAIPQPAAIGVVVLLAGYVALLIVGPRWIPLLRRADLIVVLDLIVVTSLLAVSGSLSSPFVYLYYFAILESAIRLPLRQALAASIATAGLILLLRLHSGSAEVLRGAGFGPGAVIAGGFLLALFLGARLRKSTQQLEAQLEELQFYNDLASRLSGELQTEEVADTLLRFFLKATGLPRGAAYVIADDGTSMAAAMEQMAKDGDAEQPPLPPLPFPENAPGGEPIVLPLPPGSTLPGAVAVCVPLICGGCTRAWLSGFAGERPPLEDPVRRLVRGIAAQGVAALEAALLYEEVQRILRRDPMRSLFAWPAFETLVKTEVERCRQLLLGFSVAEIQLEDASASPAPRGDRELALRRAVTLIQAPLRRVDLLSYDGAGRFALLLPRLTKARAMEQVQSIVAKLEHDPVASRLLKVDHLGIAAGVATFPEDGANESSLLAAVEGLLTREPSRPARVQVPVL